MNKGLLAVLVLLAVVAGFVLVPRLLKKPHQPPGLDPADQDQHKAEDSRRW